MSQPESPAPAEGAAKPAAPQPKPPAAEAVDPQSDDEPATTGKRKRSRKPPAASMVDLNLNAYVDTQEREVEVDRLEFDDLLQQGQTRCRDLNRVEQIVDGLKLNPPDKPVSVVVWAKDNVGVPLPQRPVQTIRSRRRTTET